MCVGISNAGIPTHKTGKGKEQEGMQVSRGLTLAEVAMPDARAPSHCVAQQQGMSYTHAQWVCAVQAWCGAFRLLPGAEVGLYFDDPFEFSAALWGAWHAGKTPVLASDLQPQHVAHLQSTVSACAGLLPHAVQPLTGAPSGQEVLQPLSLHTAQVVLFTSGSTGAPERITKQLAQLDAEVHALEAAFGACMSGAGVQVLATVSQQHIYGLLFRILWPLSAGRMLGTVFARYTEELVQHLKTTPQAALVSSPAMLSRLPEHWDWSLYATRLCAVYSSGGPLSAEASAHTLAVLGHSPNEVFGSSETGGIAWRRRVEHGDTWQPLPGVEVQLQADGCLAVRSAHLQDPHQWWTTADRAQATSQGNSFVLQGRVDRIVKIAEKRISLTAIEQTLHSHEWVQQAKAVVLEQHADAARIGMVVELSATGWQALQQQGRRAVGHALRMQLEPSVERVALPRHWRYVTRLPMNAQSKITQQSLLTLFNPLMPTAQWLQRSATEALARMHIDANLRVLEGHFPKAVLVPGVAQLHWVVSLGAEAFGIAPQFTRAEVLKFQQPILPGDTVEMRLQWHADKHCLQFALNSARGAHASGRLLQGACA